MGSTVALVPARGGSKRVPGKNMRLLGGAPLIAYTVTTALDSGEFDLVLVSSDDTAVLETAHRYGADVIRRPGEFASDTSPDIEWVAHALTVLSKTHDIETFSILRPTSPFRTGDTVRRAFRCWRDAAGSGFTSMRAVEPAAQHPAKMWRAGNGSMTPLLLQPSPQPWHDSQYSVLPKVYVQNASLEIAHACTVQNTGTISGDRVLPFMTEGHEGFDINTELDWALAELLVARGKVTLPVVPGQESSSSDLMAHEEHSARPKRPAV